jgi:phosphatidylserine/phosphatidylglycerophosphate/cardiolipin synthase-like enzyme
MSLRSLSPHALTTMAEALQAGRVAPPYHSSTFRGLVPQDLEGEIGAWLEARRAEGMSPFNLATTLRLLAEERHHSQALVDRAELVWSGTEVAGSAARDTRIVVQDLFRGARRTVLVASYALDTGEKAHALFAPLAERMDAVPGLQVRMYLNVQRTWGNQTPEAEIVATFARHFRKDVWPGQRMPEVYHDRRALQTGPERACLHAKCIVVDSARALITSANFTEAAHARNLEAGILIADATVARALQGQFNVLVERGLLRRVGGI